MVAIWMYLKQPNFIYLCTYLLLATLAVTEQEVKPFRKFIAGGPVPENQESKRIEVAALGRPLYLGTLYDCRKDSLIPGLTLWDMKSLSENVLIQPKRFTYLNLRSLDSLDSKSSLLGVSASLKASFLGGLVEVDGSGQFLRDTKSSNHQSRVTLHYSETTRLEELTMSQLSRFTYPKVFDEKTATHVVTAVLYGAQAVMVFDRTISEEENKQKIEGHLEIMVKNINGFSVNGDGSVNMTDDQKKTAEKTTCTFYGDYLLKKNPTTFKEAIQTYKTLPTLLGENLNNVVPIKAWLYPLHLLIDKAAPLQREISTNLVSSFESITEKLGEAERTCNDLINSEMIPDYVFRDIKKRLESFQRLLRIYKTMLLKEFGRVLSAVRGGDLEETHLQEILKISTNSPFNDDNIIQWLDDAKSELNTLSSVTDSLKGIKIAYSEYPMNILYNRRIHAVVSLTFTSLDYEDPYLSTLMEFLKSNKFKELDRSNPFFPVKSPRWFSEPDVTMKMIETVSQFIGFAEANKDEERIKFLISALSNPSIAGSSIYLYEKRKLPDTQFQPVSKPPPPIVEHVQAQTVSLKLQTSSSRERVHYKVEYKQVKAHPGAEEPWLFIDTYDENITLTGLEFGKQYWIRCRIVFKMGQALNVKVMSGIHWTPTPLELLSEASDTVIVTISGNPQKNVTDFHGFFTSIEPKNWYDSRQFCRDHGGNLVIIKSVEKQMHVSSAVQKIGAHAWIGLSDIERKHQWKWVDNSPLKESFWREGEPNDIGGIEDCIVVHPKPTLRNWNDIQCSVISNFLCE